MNPTSIHYPSRLAGGPSNSSLRSIPCFDLSLNGRITLIALSLSLQKVYRPDWCLCMGLSWWPKNVG
ncbi:hypothetical protein P8452_67471 [Trifolium repens]|nr:hypothetical protein P8452_67471 [Trifolium repens]